MTKIAIIVSKFNQEITDLMEKNAVGRAQELGVFLKIYRVPGAVEIPLIAKKLSLNNEFDAIVVLGAVIRGEKTHYDYVYNQVSYGYQKIALSYNIPIIFGILTCETEVPAYDRIGEKIGNKPKDMIDLVIYINNLPHNICYGE